MPLPRRCFLLSTVFFSFAALASRARAASTDKAAPKNLPKPPPKPPALSLEKVSAIVGAAHRDLEKVRTLLDETPLLANACLDQGGGDFETPLQAAAHTGRREIAELLLSRNARLDVYAAAMLGHLDFVRAALAADVVAAAAVPGPHGFTLLHCAKQGGPKARPVVDWLLASNVPDVGQRPLPFVWPKS